MGPTIAYFKDLLAQHPEHPVFVFELGGAYDTDGQEERARVLYERALELGLTGEPLRRCLCHYGSTLRWLGRSEESLAVLTRARRAFPDSDGVRVFLALTLHEAGRGDAAIGELLSVITKRGEVTDLGHWAEELRRLGKWLSEGRPEQ
jgi:tetratricopeptide (TPR) repeat protein